LSEWRRGTAPAGGSSLSIAVGCAEPPVRGGRSTIGRPRVLTDQQVEVLLAEHARFLAWQALRKSLKSQRELAREFGVSQATISLAVRSQGLYKQVSPEERNDELRRRREWLARLRARGLL
jgi:hypothetical protein